VIIVLLACRSKLAYNLHRVFSRSDRALRPLCRQRQKISIREKTKSKLFRE
jgi:hypothetical protein